MESSTPVQQITHLTDASVARYEQAVSAGLNAMEQSLDNLHAGSAAAELAKHNLKALHELTRFNNQVANQLLSSTLQAMNLAAFSQSSRMLAEIGESLLNTYVNNRMNLLKALTGTTADFLDTCARVKRVEDLYIAQTNYLSDIQEDLRNGAGADVQYLDQAKASLDAWSERTIDLYCQSAS